MASNTKIAGYCQSTLPVFLRPSFHFLEAAFSLIKVTAATSAGTGLSRDGGGMWGLKIAGGYNGDWGTGNRWGMQQNNHGVVQCCYYSIIAQKARHFFFIGS